MSHVNRGADLDDVPPQAHPDKPWVEPESEEGKIIKVQAQEIQLFHLL